MSNRNSVRTLHTDMDCEMYPKDEVGMGIRRQRIIRDSRKYAAECLKRKKEDGRDEVEEHPPQEWRRHGSMRKRRVQLEHVGEDEEERGLEQLEMSPGEKRRRVRREAQPKKTSSSSSASSSATSSVVQMTSLKASNTLLPPVPPPKHFRPSTSKRPPLPPKPHFLLRDKPLPSHDHHHPPQSAEEQQLVVDDHPRCPYNDKAIVEQNGSFRPLVNQPNSGEQKGEQYTTITTVASEDQRQPHRPSPKAFWENKENRAPPPEEDEAGGEQPGGQQQVRAVQAAPGAAAAAKSAAMAAADSPQHHHPQQPDSNVDLEQVLKSEVARAPFHQFLQQQFCAENINFYLAVEEYKKIPDTERDRRTDFGRQIFDRHFAANCIEPVNIDNSTSNQIREAYKHNRFTVDVYDVVQYQIFHLLKYDCWPRYLRAGGQLAEELGGDAKSHDSGASTSRNAEQCLVVGGGGDHCKSSRRKSLLRFLRLMRAEEGDNGDGDNGVECCECCHHRRRPFGTLNGMVSSSRPSTATAAGTRARSRSPSRRAAQLARRARRSCVEGRGGGGQSATMTMSLMSTKSVGEHCTCRCRWCRTHSQHKFGEPTFPVRFCTLLCADSATSTEIALSDPFQSVKQWTAMMADNSGLDKSACEVVDAQTGSTIDPVRQAVDALNNRVVRIIPVVKFPVVFLAPTAPCSGTKPTAPPPAKVAILRCRPALTVGKVLRPIMAKYNVDTEQAVVCIAGTCEVLKLQTPVSAIYLKTLAVMSQQQFAERKVLPKREYQKELTLVPPWMTSSASGSSGQSSPGPESPHHPPFHQHGDVGFCELPLEAEGGKLGSGLLKHSATRSYSSNPREFFKFGRKPTMVKSRGAEAESVNAPGTSGTIEASVSTHPGTSSMGTHLRYRKSGGSGMGGGGRNSMAKEADRRKSLGAAASAAAAAGAGTPMDQGGGAGTPTGSTAGGGGRLSSAALAVGLVAPSDIPYCGEVEPPEEPPLAQEMCSTYGVPSMMSRHESVYATKSAVIASSVQQDYPMEGTGGSQEELSRNRGTTAFASVSGANGQPSSGAGPSLPAIFSTAVRSDKDSGGGGGISPSPSTDSGAMVWQKADYV